MSDNGEERLSKDGCPECGCNANTERWDSILYPDYCDSICRASNPECEYEEDEQ